MSEPDTASLPDQIAQNVRQFSQSQNVPESDVAAAIRDTYDSLPDSMDEPDRWSIAWKRGKKSLVDASSLGSGSSAGEVVSVITIGYGRVSQWPDRNHDDYREGMDKDAMPRKDVLLTSGIVRREETGRTDIASIIFDSTDGVNLAEAMDVFSEPYTVFSGRFNVADPKTSNTGFVLYSTRATELELVEDAMPEEDRKQLVERHVDDVDIASIANNPRANLSLSDGNGAADFGIDIKRIQGATIYDHWVDEDRDRGVYTILDDSVMGPSELEGSQLDSENQRVAGLSAWASVDLMEYDDDSICDFYGVVREGRDGQISMDVRGIDPIYAEPRESTTQTVGSQSAESF